MGLARRDILGGDGSGNGQWVHCISRCVRRAFLCGDGLDHRKEYIENRLRLLSDYAAVEMAAYSVMSNHLHVVLRMRRDLSDDWSDREVARRWLTLFPRRGVSDGQGPEPSAEDIAIAARSPQVAQWRGRLADLGWAMKALKEDLSRTFNREDQCSGAFWEGRYKSVLLADQAALIACMAYVDLNPIRAKMADRPENSDRTGIQTRVRARQAFAKAKGLEVARKDHQEAEKVSEKAGRIRQEGGLHPDARHLEDGLWLTPLARCTVRPVNTLQGLQELTEEGNLPGPVTYGAALSAEEYFTLVDATGRILRGDKRGHIPPELAPILARLDIQVNDWLKTMLGWRQFMGRLIGSAATRIAAAGEHGLRWIQNRCALFSAPPKPRQRPSAG
jgi:REP element-mobilizing transposase RayT